MVRVQSRVKSRVIIDYRVMARVMARVTTRVTGIGRNLPCAVLGVGLGLGIEHTCGDRMGIGFG